MSADSPKKEITFDWDPNTQEWSGPVKASKTFSQFLIYWICWCIWGFFGFFAFRSHQAGRDNIPKKGPFVLLGNHVSMFDPAWAAFPVPRSDVHFMASASLFAIPILGPLIRALGAFPKAKFSKDRTAMVHMLRKLKKGGVVVLFPEGRRTWDGSTVRPMPGTGKFLQRTRIPVVFCRNLTGHLYQPRWAIYPRYVPIKLDYSKPVVFDASMSDEEVNDGVYNGIRIDPDAVEVPPRSFGFRMAYGLPTYIWACPECLTMEALDIHPKSGNAIQCTSCQKAWRVDVACMLHPMGHEGPVKKVSDVANEIAEAIVPAEHHTPGKDGEPDVILRCDEGRIRDVPRGGGTPKTIAEGPARMTTEALEIFDGSGAVVWSLPLEEITSASLDVASRFFLRTEAGAYLEFRPLGQSTNKWIHFMMPYLHMKNSDFS